MLGTELFASNIDKLTGDFQLEQDKSGTFFVLKRQHADFLRQLLLSPPQEDSSIGTGKGRTRFYSTPDEDVALKEYSHGGLLAPLIRDIYLYPPHRSLVELQLLATGFVRGLPVPEPLGAAVIPVMGPFFRYRLCTARVAGGRNLLDRLKGGERGHEERCAFALRKLHDGGIYHNDLNLANFILSDTDTVICDLDRGRLEVCLTDRQRQKNIKRLARSVAKQQVTGVFSMERFIAAYGSTRERS